MVQQYCTLYNVSNPQRLETQIFWLVPDFGSAESSIAYSFLKLIFYLFFYTNMPTGIEKLYLNKTEPVSLVYSFRGWAKSFPLLSRVYTPAEDDSPQKRTAIR